MRPWQALPVTSENLIGVPRHVPPLVLVTGPEQVLADRAVASVLTQLRVTFPQLDVVRLDAATYTPGDVIAHAAPSLFGEDKAIVVADVDEAGDELQGDLLALLAVGLEPGSTLIVRHKGGNRGRKVLDAMTGAGARVLEAPAIKTDRDKTDFATHEFRAAGRRATAGAISALIEAVGSNVAELASACQQLIADTTGVIDEAVVTTYHGGKVVATGFRVADATLAGNASEALRLLRHAIAAGVDPVPIVAVLAQQLRQLVRVGNAGRGRSVDIARDLGLAPWQVDKANRLLPGWSAEGLGRSIQALAAADAEVKGGGRDAVFAVERAILTITDERQPR